MIPPLVGLALDYYRNPMAYAHLADGSFPLPRGFGDRFSELASALSPKNIEATAHLLASSQEELEAAARFFARHTLLDPAADYYRCLGTSPRASRSVIRAHYLFLIRLFHPDRLPHATETDLACSRRLNVAYHVLSDAQQRTRYDRERRNAARPAVHSDPRDFFGPHQVPLSGLDHPPPKPRSPHARGWRTAVVAFALTIAIAGLMLWKLEPTRLHRLPAPMAEDPDPPLRHSARNQVPPGDGAPTAATALAVPPQVVPPIQVTWPFAKYDELQSDPDPAAIGVQVVGDLQIAFRRGDTARLSELFDQPVQTDSGWGRWLLHKAKHHNAADSEKLWLTITGTSWQRVPDGRISGRGLVLLSHPDAGAPFRNDFRGKVELELVPVDSEYRIRTLRIAND